VIRACSNEGDLVLDPFLGSGTTCTVARALGRRSIGIEYAAANAESAFNRIKNGAVRIKQKGEAKTNTFMKHRVRLKPVTGDPAPRPNQDRQAQ
jgi:DNA modification methylase